MWHSLALFTALFLQAAPAAPARPMAGPPPAAVVAPPAPTTPPPAAPPTGRGPRGGSPAAASASPPTSVRGPLRPRGPNFDRKRDYDLRHLRFEVDFNLKERSIRGVATNTIAAIAGGLTEARFDAEYLTIDKVTVGGQPAKHRVDKDAVVVTLPKPLGAGGVAEVAITYHGSPPSGLHWVGPEPGYPNKPYQVWSQGEDMDNHLWIPTWDFPNDKTTWEAILTVPDDLYAVSNGVLMSTGKGPRAGTSTFHYKMNEPNVTYLIAVAVGPWVRFADSWRGKPVEYFVPKGIDEATTRRAFGKTPAMMDLFSKLMGVDYPWNKYAQTAIAEFMVSGMENVSATLQTDRTLRDETAQLDGTSDDLVSHELAHQWWGDLITCRDWSHLWLNEGFATYFTGVWNEHTEGPAALAFYMRSQAGQFKQQDGFGEPRPLVESYFSTPEGDRTHSHQYTKGSSVIHMLRFVVGDDLFWKALRLFAQRHKYGQADTEDLRRAFAEVTGDPLEWFFDEWVYAAGHPHFEVTTAWDARTSTERVRVVQKQKVGGLVPQFTTPVAIKLFAGGKARVERVWIKGEVSEFSFKLPAAPDFVHFDDGGWILKTVTHEKPAREWLAQLARDDDPIAKVEAIEALADMPGNAEAASAVAAAARDAKLPWPLRARAAGALGSWRRHKGARQAALAALGDTQARVRANAAEALEAFLGDEEVARALEKTMANDKSPATRARAVESLAGVLGRAGWDRVARGLETPSFRDEVKAATLNVLARLDAARAFPLLLEEARYGKPYETRTPATNQLGQLASGLDEASRLKAAEVLAEGAAQDRFSRMRGTTIRALAATGTSKAREVLDRVGKSDDREPFRRQAKDALERMNKQDLAADENRKLRARIDQLEQRLRTPAPSAP